MLCLKHDCATRWDRVSSFRTVFLPLCLSLVVAVCFVVGTALPCRAADMTEENAQEVFSILLRGNPSTGHFWSWTADGDGAVRETGIDYAQENDMPGSPATYTYSFVGEKEGEVTLRFVYSQTEPPSPRAPVNVYTLKVLPDGRILSLGMQEDIVGKPQPQW